MQKEKETEAIPKKIKDIHKIMRDGLLYDKNIENRFNNLESIIQSFLKKIEKGKKIKIRI